MERRYIKALIYLFLFNICVVVLIADVVVVAVVLVVAVVMMMMTTLLLIVVYMFCPFCVIDITMVDLYLLFRFVSKFFKCRSFIVAVNGKEIFVLLFPKQW